MRITYKEPEIEYVSKIFADMTSGEFCLVETTLCIKAEIMDEAGDVDHYTLISMMHGETVAYSPAARHQIVEVDEIKATRKVKQ